MDESKELLTFGLAGLRVGAQAHHLRRLAGRGLIPFTKAGRLHLIAVVDLPAVREACEKAGYLQTAEAAGAR